MIEKASNSLAMFLKHNGSEESHEVLSYALANIINVILVALAAITIGFISGKPHDTMMALIAFGVIRYLSGGLHMKTMDLCFIVSTAIIVIPPHIVISTNVVLGITLVGLLSYILFAPNVTEELNSKKDNKIRYKVVSIALVAANLYFQSSTLALVYLVQAVMIIPYSKKGGAQT